MLKKIIIILLFLFMFSMLKLGFHHEVDISKPVGANFIQFTTDSHLDESFIKYLDDNNIEIYREIEDLPYFYTKQINKNIIYPFDEYSIEEKLLSSDNSGIYYMNFNGDMDYPQLADYLKSEYDLETVNTGQVIPQRHYTFFNKYSTPLIIITTICLIICLFIETLKLSNEVLIKRINGYSDMKIIMTLCIKDVIFYFIIFLLSFFIYFIYSGYLSFTEIRYALEVGLLINFISICSRVIFIKLMSKGLLKDRQGSKFAKYAIVTFTIFLTVALISTFLLPIMSMTRSNLNQINITTKLIINKSKYEDYYFVEDQLNNSDDGVETFKQAMKHGGFTFTYAPSTASYNEIIVNTEYIDIFYPNLKGYTLIAPEQAEEQIQLMCESNDLYACENIFYYTGDQQVFSYDLYYPGYLKNPIVTVSNDSIGTQFVLPRSSENILEEIEQEYESDYTVGRQYTTIDQYITKQLKSLIRSLSMYIVIVLGFICSILLINQIYIEYYLQENKREILVKTVSGIANQKIHANLIYFYACMLILNMIIILILTKLFYIGVVPLLMTIFIYLLIAVVNGRYIKKYTITYYGGR